MSFITCNLLTWYATVKKALAWIVITKSKRQSIKYPGQTSGSACAILKVLKKRSVFMSDTTPEISPEALEAYVPEGSAEDGTN